MNNEQQMTVKEVAEELGVSYRTIIRLIHEGMFPGAYKIGSGKTMPWLIPVSSFEEYKKKHSDNE